MESSSPSWKGRGGRSGGGGGRGGRGRGRGGRNNRGRGGNGGRHRRPTSTKQPQNSTSSAVEPPPITPPPITTISPPIITHNSPVPPKNSNNTNVTRMASDEDVLIEFGQLLRNGDEGAYHLYHNTPPHDFVEAARHYLQKDNDMEKMVNDLMNLTTTTTTTTSPASPPPPPTPPLTTNMAVHTATPPRNMAVPPIGTSTPTRTTVAAATTPTTTKKATNDDTNEKEEKTTTAPTNKWQPKRKWMRLEEQPGQLLANNSSLEIQLGPRQSLLATWKLPLEFLRRRMVAKYSTTVAHVTVQDALQNLTVGLFRRGCMDHTSSIISKPVIPPGQKGDYQFQVVQNVIWGTVPFYTPRTPGNVVLRLFFDQEEETLATSPKITVGVTEEATLRFLLSHFKSASSGNNNMISTLYSTALVLEQLNTPAGRAGWGCICESTKIYQNFDKQKNERKWKDVQAAYSAILKAVITNNDVLLLKKEYLYQTRLEYELWCPLSETFAPAIPNKSNRVARELYQKEIFGFVPKLHTLTQLLVHGNNKKGKSQSSAHQSRMVLQRLSNTMTSNYYQTQQQQSSAEQKREEVRRGVQDLLVGIFPPNTRVVIFGSSANGFGSPTSDLDMCLETSSSSQPVDESAMEKLASALTEVASEIDTGRLTARIPVLKFVWKNGMECDLSMQNPLACLNTALLAAYANVRPEVPIVASIIKQWAKHRNINDPSKNTLSSYGYILMLLHFLTTHSTTPQGLTTSTLGDQASIVPNLQWLHRPLQQQKQPHPSDPSFNVDTYYYSKPIAEMNLPLCPSVGILLSSFFRYYAHEFDYKKQVISLSSPRKMVERETKAEHNGWKLYGPALCIEDPFETFYDVAHVLKPSTFATLKQEFARAYSIIVHAATLTWDSGGVNQLTGEQLLESICEPPPPPPPPSNKTTNDKDTSKDDKKDSKE